MTPVLHAVAGDAVAGSAGFDALAEGLYAVCGGSLAVHLRLRCSAAELHRLASSLSRTAAPHGGWSVVNGRVDVALAAGARAVQLGHTAIGVGAARRAIAATGGDLLVGASVHGVPEAVAAAACGANYLILGTIFATPSHEGRRGAGTRLVTAVREALDAGGFETVPVIAIGGIGSHRAPGVKQAGAHGVAVQRAIWDARDPRAAAAELCAAMTTE